MTKRLPIFIVAAAAAALAIVAYFNRPDPSHGPAPRTTGPRPVDPRAPDQPLPAPHEHGPECGHLPKADLDRLPAGSVSVYVHSAGTAVASVPVVLWSDPLHAELRAETDERGTCEFARVPAGPWLVFARHPQYVPATSTTDVLEGQRAQVTLSLATGARLVGTVTDEQNRPVPGATLSILDVSTRKLLLPGLRCSAGPDGSYDVRGIPLGPAGLHVLAPKFRPVERYDLQFAVEGEVRREDLRLRAGTVVAGRVVDLARAPVAGAVVSGSNEHSIMTRTDAEGRFIIEGLGDQAVNLFAQARGYGTVFRRGVAPGTLDLEIVLPKGAAVRGRVSAAPPPATFSVLFHRWEEDFGKELLVLAPLIRQSKDGAFEVRDVAPGHYKVSIQAEGYEVASPVEIVVHPGTDVEGVVIAAARRP